MDLWSGLELCSRELIWSFATKREMVYFFKTDGSPCDWAPCLMKFKEKGTAQCQYQRSIRTNSNYSFSSDGSGVEPPLEQNTVSNNDMWAIQLGYISHKPHSVTSTISAQLVMTRRHSFNVNYSPVKIPQSDMTNEEQYLALPSALRMPLGLKACEELGSQLFRLYRTI